jgi:chromate transporter
MATYVGYTVTGNIWGSLLATLAVSLPSLVVMYAIVRFIQAFRQNKWISAAFEGIKPVTVGLVGSAAILLMNAENFSDYISLIIFGCSFLLSWVFKVHPILLIVLAGLTGLLVY